MKYLPLFHHFKAIYQFSKHIIFLVKIVANAFKIFSISSSDRSANLDVANFVFSKRYTDNRQSRDIRVQLSYATNKSRASGQQMGPGSTDRKLLTVNRSLIQGFFDFLKNSKNVDFYS